MSIQKLNLVFFKNFNSKYKYNYNIIYNLRKQFGINYGKVGALISYLGVNKKAELQYCNKFIINNINYCLKTYYKVSNALVLQYLRLRIKKYIITKSLRGFRHENNLPIHSQRTHTNGRTQKFLKRYTLLFKLDVNNDKTIIQKRLPKRIIKKKKTKKH
jgi:ribosomal protein S13